MVLFDVDDPAQADQVRRHCGDTSHQLPSPRGGIHLGCRKRKGVEVVALQGLDLHVEAGELTAIVGASGSGKSTLLNILSGLDTPSAGRADVAGHDLLAMGRTERRRYRLETCGFVWQQPSDNLVPYLTALENVQVPQRLAGSRGAEA